VAGAAQGRLQHRLCWFEPGFHGLSPKLFDEVASTRRQPWHSFNLGMDKMGMAQSMKIIRELVATGPRNLRYVLFEMESGTGMLPVGQNRAARPGGLAQAPDNHRLGGLGPDGDGFSLWRDR